MLNFIYRAFKLQNFYSNSLKNETSKLLAGLYRNKLLQQKKENLQLSENQELKYSMTMKIENLRGGVLNENNTGPRIEP